MPQKASLIRFNPSQPSPMVRVGFGVLVAIALTTIGCGGPDETAGDSVTDNSDTDRMSVPEPADESGMTLPEGGIKASSDDQPSGSGKFTLPPEGSTPPDEQNESATGLQLPPELSSGTKGTAAPEIQIASWETISKSIQGNNKVTVIDLWSLSCIPCLKEFPGLVALHDRLGDRVECIGVDVDFDGRKSRPPETYQPRVEEFIKSVNAKFTNYIASTASEDLLEAAGVVTIPSVLVFDKQGNLVKVFTATGDGSEFTYEKDVTPLVESLVS